MILIADSGATKTSWRLLHEDNTIEQVQTKGFNPYHHNADVLEQEVTEALLPHLDKDVVKQIFYYGAGCSAPEKVNMIKETFYKIFPKAVTEVNHDMLGAARALCGKNEGIACILGTGANSCHFDGVQIISNEPTLGFILGDEGSGAYLGKMLLSAFIRKELPDVIMSRLQSRFELSREIILQNVYQGGVPARYLASFSKFIFQNLQTPELYKMVYEAFELFFRKNVMKYEGYEKLPVHFTGSVAFYYGNILRQVAVDLGIYVRNIIEDPIAGLTLYHQNILSDENLK